MQFGDKVLRFRIKHGLTQVAAAKVLGVSRFMIIRYESGGCEPHKKRKCVFERNMAEYEKKERKHYGAL